MLVSAHLEDVGAEYGPACYRFEIYHESNDCPNATDEEFDCTCKGVEIKSFVLVPPEEQRH